MPTEAPAYLPSKEELWVAGTKRIQPQGNSNLPPKAQGKDFTPLAAKRLANSKGATTVAPCNLAKDSASPLWSPWP